MAKGNRSRDRVTKWIRWIVRIWSFPIMVYALLLLVGYAWNWVTTGVADPYAVEDYPPTEALPPIFTFLSIVGLGIAWRWERLGGAIVVVFQLAVLSLLLVQRPLTDDFPRLAIPYLLSMIVTIPGVLFLICWWRSRSAAIE
jgi:membrane-anchored protein YejM (alkaline phosphatase superfamily)